MSVISPITLATHTIANCAQSGINRVSMVANRHFQLTCNFLDDVKRAIGIDVSSLGDLAEGLTPAPDVILGQIKRQLMSAGKSNKLYVLEHPSYKIRIRVIKADTGTLNAGGAQFSFKGGALLHDGPHNKLHDRIISEVKKIAEEAGLPLDLNIGYQLFGKSPVDLFAGGSS